MTFIPPKRKPNTKRNKTAFHFLVPEDILEEFEVMRAKAGLSRAALAVLMIRHCLEEAKKEQK